MTPEFCPSCGIGLNNSEMHLRFCQNCKFHWSEEDEEDFYDPHDDFEDDDEDEYYDGYDDDDDEDDDPNDSINL